MILIKIGSYWFNPDHISLIYEREDGGAEVYVGDTPPVRIGTKEFERLKDNLEAYGER